MVLRTTKPIFATRRFASVLLLAGVSLLWAPSALAVAPVAVADTFSTPNGVAVNDDLSTNDTGLDGPADIYILGTAPSNGTALVNADGSFTYSPNSGFAGTDTFTYTIDDGAGGTSSASVAVNVASATDFLSAANPLIITQEDTSVPLGLTVAQDLFDGGALQDIVSTDVLFRPANGGATPLTTTIPAGVTGITITAYSTQSTDTAGPNDTDDDYQLLNVRLDLIGKISSGRLANIVAGNLSTLDQYSWINVPLGQFVLSDPSKVVGFSTGASDPMFTVIGSQLQIVENHTLETIYHVEFTTASGDSTNFLGAESSVQVNGETQSTITIDADVEPSSGKHGLIILSSNSADGGNFEFEYKGFNRFVIDFDKGMVSGAIAVLRGESENNTVTYGFEGYPLVDLRNGPAAVSDVISGSNSVVGDVTGIPEVLDNPTLYIDASGELVIERQSDFANNFTSLYTAEAYERTGFGSIASFVAVDSDDTLFNTNGGLAPDGGPANELHFDVPASAQVGLAQVSWNTVGGDDTNENMGAGFAVIDLASGTTSGSIMFVRATTPDLVSWGSVPLNTTMFGAFDAAGNPLYESNKTAGRFTDFFGENARFTLVNLADGSRTIVFTARNGNGNQTFRQYQGNMQISWLGSEPFEIEGVPVTGTLSHGSPTDNDTWEIDFSELPLLSYIPIDNSSELVNLEFALSSSGETEGIDVYIEPVVDPVVITANDSAGYEDLPVPLSIGIAASVDVDGSETEPDSLRLQGVPPSVVLSSSAGTVTNVSSGIWEVSESALASLQAVSPVAVSAAVSVLGEQVDESDLDSNGVIDDNANSVGADELDVLTITEVFQLDIFDIPTVVPQVTNLVSPVITGDANLATGETLSVTVNGITYTSGDGNLVVNANGTWMLTIPAANALPEGLYSVEAEKSHSGGASAPDITSSELLIDLIPPPAPGVTSQTTQDLTPLISGTTHVGTGDVLSVEVNGIFYTEGDGNLVNNGDGTWDLTIPASDALTDNLYQVIARLTDPAGNTTPDSGVDDLVVDTTAPPSPGVTGLVTNDDTPVISGTATLGTGEALTVEVNGIIYTAGDGNLVDNGDGTWDLSIPPSDVLPEATYDVTATVMDAAGNLSIDPSSTELVIDLTLPSTPTVFSQFTNNTTPVISGLATVLTGEVLNVAVNGVLYTAGDGNLTDNLDGTWDLIIPPGSALLENVYNVTATVTDTAGNSTQDGTISELIVDLTPTAAPTVILTGDINNDVLLNAVEAINPQPVDIVLPAGAVAGDTLLWTDTVSPANTVLTAADIAAGVVSTTVALPADGVTLTVSSLLVDKVGNNSPSDNDSATVDITAPIAPSVTSLITNTPLPIVSGTANLAVGDVLIVEVNGITYTAGDGNLLANGDGTWDLTIPATDALAEATYDVTASVSDTAGNVSVDPSSAELVIDLTATGAPTIVLTADTNNDALLNAAEAQSPQPVEITIPAGAVAGDTLLWTDGSSPANTVLSAADIAAGVVSTTVALPADGSVLTVTSVLTDQAGNTSPSDNDSATVDTTVPSAPIIVITEDTDNNSFLNIAESTGPVDVSIQLPADAAAGDTLTITLDGVVSTVVLSASDITAGVVSVATPATPSGSTVVAEAFITDPAGNATAIVDDTAVVDISAPLIPTVNTLTTNNATPTLSGNSAIGPGDVLTVTVNGVTYTDGDSFLTFNGASAWALAIPAGDALVDGTYDVVVSLTDPAGNTSFDATFDELIVDTVVPAVPTVISQITNSQVPVISGTATVGAGENLTIEVNGIIYTVGDGNLIDNTDGTWDLTIPAADALPEAVYAVTATVTDAAGNATTDITAAELTIDLTATASPTVVLTADLNNDALLNIAEAIDPQPVDIILPVGAKVGDTLLWTDSVAPANTVLTAADIAAGVVSTTVALPADGSVLTVSSVITDVAGNVSPSGFDSALVDITVSDPPVIAIVSDADNNGLLNNAEAVSPQPINILLPATAGVGFTLTVTDGTTVSSFVLTASDIAAGVVSTTVMVPADGSNLSVSANLEDIAGNISTDGADLALVDLSVPDEPTIVISEDANNDGFINIAENVGAVDVLVTLPANAAVGDELTTSIRGVVTTGVLSAADINAGVLSFTTAAPSQGAFVIAEAFITDPAGNASTTASDIAQLDISPPFVPTVISQIINTGTPLITGTAAVGPNDILRVLVNGVTYLAGDGNLVDNVDGTWALTIPPAEALASATYGVVVRIEDPAGNITNDVTINELIVDLVAPAAPTVNALLTNLAEPILTGTAVVGAGETLSVTVNGVTYTESDGNLALDASGDWTLTIPASDALADAAHEVLAEVSDLAGNVTADASANELVVDLTATGAPTVVLTADTNNDALLNLAEAQSPQPVEITLPAGAVVGDTLLWTDGSSPANTVLSAADIAAGVVSTTVALPADGSVLTVTSVLTDQAGNTSPSDNDSATVDTTTPSAPTIVIAEDADDNSFLNIAESTGPVDVNIQLPADAAAGDTLTITLDGVVSTVVLSASDITAGVVSVTTPATPSGSTVVAEAFITDPAGNATVTVDDTAVVDISAPFIPTVNALTTNNAMPTLTGNAAVGPGDVLTVTVNGVTYTDGDGFLTYNGAGAWALAIPASDTLVDGTYDVGVSLTDPASNTSFDITVDELMVDTVVPVVPTVIAQTTNTPVPVISGTATVGAGEILSVEVNGITYVVGDGNIIDNADGTWDLTIPAADALPEAVYEVTATVTDAAGNATTDITAAELTIDLTATASPTVVLTADINNDALLNIAEAIDPQPVDIILPVGAKVGDTLLWTDSVAPANTVLTAADIAAGVVSATVALPADGSVLTVSSVLTDQAGNASPGGNDSATVDVTTSAAPTIIIAEDIDNNSFLNIAELMGLVNVSVQLPVDAAAGDTLTVTLDGVISTVVLSASDIATGEVGFTTPAPTSGSTIQAEAFLTDPSGNTTATADDSAVVDISAPFIPTVNALITNNSAPTLTGNAAVGPGDVLTVTVNGLTYTEGDGFLSHNGAGAWVLAIASSDALADGNYDVEVGITDPAGNLSVDTTVDELTVDTAVPASPTVTLSADLNNDGLLNIAEAQNPQPVDIVLPVGAKVGDTLLWTDTVSPANTVLTAADIAAGVVSTTVVLPVHGSVLTVSSVLTDVAGNASPSGSDSATVDISAPFIPTVHFLETNSSTPTLTGNAAVGPGDVLTVTVNGVSYTEGDGFLSYNGSGAWALGIPISDALADGPYDVSVSLTDPAGNTSVDSTVDELVIDTVAPQAPGVTSQTTPDSTPIISGTTPINPSLNLTVEVNGVTYTEGDGNLVVNTNGTWDLTLPATDALADGLYQVVATVTDLAGNRSVDSGIDDLVIDTVLPTTPGVTSQVTNTTVPIIAGTAIVGLGETLTVDVNGITYTAGDGRLIDNGDGTWLLNIPVTNALPEAVYSVTATVTDLAGNATTDPSSTELIIDLTAPDVPTVTPQLSNLATPTVLGTAVVLAGETLTVTINGVVYTAGDGNLVGNGDGTWVLSIPAANALPEGTHDVMVNVLDQAGNSTNDASINELEIDLSSTAAPTPILTADVNNDEFLNASEAQSIQAVTILLPAGAAVGDTLLWSDSVTPQSAVLSAADIAAASFQTSVPLPTDGSVLAVTSVLVDLAGNASPSGSDSATVDNTVPAAPTIVITEDTDDDSFLNISEIMGSVDVVINLPAGVVAGDELIITIDGVSRSIILNSGDIILGSIGVTTPAPAQNASVVAEAFIVDPAGNPSAVSDDIAVVDNSAPFVPSVSSLITNNVTPLIAGNAAVGPGDVLQVIVNGILYTDGDGALASNGNGAWSLNIPATDALDDGVYEVLVRLTDPAGNSTIDVSLNELVVDTVLPQAPAVTSQTTSNPTPVISGSYTIAAGHTLSVLVNGVSYSSGDGQLSANPDGTWSLQIPNTASLSDGLYQVVATSTDLASNAASDPMVDDLLVDTLLPSAPGVISLVTNSAAPVVQGTVSLSPGEIFSVTVNGVTYTLGDGQLVLNPGGTWSLSIPASDELGEGVYDVVATVTDLAGNVISDPSSSELLIDTTVPVAPTVTAQPSNTPTPIIGGTVELMTGEVFTVTVNGVVYTVGDGNLVVNSNGTWELTLPASDALAEGVYNVVATVTDAAGNVTSDITVDELVIDLTAPAMPSFTDVLSGSTTPTIGGQVVLEPGEVFTVTVNGVTYLVGDGFLTVDANGNWELMIDPLQPLVDGVYDVMLNIEDAAGNSVSNATGEQITIDTGAPNLTVDSLGTVTTYQPPLSGTTNVADGSVVIIRDSNGNVVCEAVVANGVWECTPTIDLIEGVNDFTAEVMDPAGNVMVVNFSVTVSADFDGDGIANSVEGFGDSDGDGVPDSADLDSDNDGIPDASESAIDSDGDGLPNYLDGDADNDGLADLLEAEGLDANRDFTVDDFIDEDNNGLSDELQAIALNIIDTDFDGVPDYLDVDSDNDGVPDLQESLGDDVDNDGRIDDFVDVDANGVDDGVQAFPFTILDSDNDGSPNHLDLNSDNDSLSDLVESIGLDINGDSIVDSMTDADQDSIPDSVDFSVIGGSDADGDDIEDSADVDFVLGDDTDGDGIVDEFDPDANGDGYFDGFADVADLPDADANEVPDLQEAFGELRTGRRGIGGCAIDAGSVSSRDPLLLMLVILAFAGFLKQRRKVLRLSGEGSGITPYAGSNVVNSKSSLWILCIVLCAASLFHSDTAHANDAEEFHKRLYLGFGAGASYLDPDDSAIPFKLEEQNDTAFGVFVGYDLGSRVSVELGFNDLGQAELEQDNTVDYQQVSVSALFYGLNRKSARERRSGLSAFARLGVTRMDNESTIGFVRDNDFSVVVGAGVELGHKSGLAVRGEVTSYDVDSNYFGLSLVYRFGHPTHRDNFVEVRSQPDVVPPLIDEAPSEPAPEITPEPEVPKVEEVEVVEPKETLPGPFLLPTVEYAVLFDTNSAELDREAELIVEDIELYLRTNVFSEVTISGYADLRGPVMYNLRLSENRAESVESSLLQRGIAQSRIHIEAGGETDRFGSMGTAMGRRENRRAHMLVIIE